METYFPQVSLALLALSIILFAVWSFTGMSRDVGFVALFTLGISIYARSVGNIKQFALFMNEVKSAIQDKSTHINIVKDKDD